MSAFRLWKIFVSVTESCLTVGVTRWLAGRDNAALTEDEILMEVFYLLVDYWTSVL